MRRALLAAGVLALAAFPLISPGPFYTSFATEILIFGLWAVSLDLLIGYTGLVSFGHAGPFGVGAYAAALLMIHWSPHLLVGLIGGTAVAAASALVVGYLSVRLPGIAFSMLTLAFAQMFFTIAFKWRSVTGGDDGLRGMPQPVLHLGPLTLDTGDRAHLYWLTLFFLLGALVFLRRVVRSPFGAVLEAIRENEERARFIGYNTQHYKWVAYILAGTLAGLAGALFALLKGFLAPNVLHWSSSGQVLMMTILGGMGTLFGPLLGAAVYVVAQEMLSTYTEHWMLFLGTLFVIVVLFAPGGIVGLVRGGQRRGRPEEEA
jgi:branched-chain amino acid transport system permease protein